MIRKKTLAAAALAVFLATATAQAAPSSWAAQEVAEAISLGIAPQELQGSYQQDIGRQEFAKVAVHTISAMEGISMQDLMDKTAAGAVFLDTVDPCALCASALGVIQGRGEGIFDPFSPITREEAAVMLRQTLMAVGALEPQANANFSDLEQAHSWARTAVSDVAGQGIMVGTGDGRFEPLGTYTREQALASFLRLLTAACPNGEVRLSEREYGFSLPLPSSWKGCAVNVSTWESNDMNEFGPQIEIKHPLSTKANPRQDIPVMAFTLDQWGRMENDEFHIGAAPINPKELGRNSHYVFALPARYNYAFLEGYEEVEEIVLSFSTFEPMLQEE